MDWTHFSPLLAEDETESSPFTDINFPLDPSLFSLPHPHPSDVFLDPLPLPESAASDSLTSLHLPAFNPPSWPAATSPPSPTASTSSASSASTNSTNSTNSPTPLPASTAPTLPATLAVSPHLLRKLHRPPRDASTANSDAGTATSRQRKRVAGLTQQQRAELKRQKHREIDANRIQREKAAVRRLTQLTDAQQQQQTRDDKIEDDEEEAEEGGGGGSSRSRDKVTVLEDSARKIDELQRLVSRLTDACNAQQANNRTLVLQLQMAVRQPPALPSSTLSSSSSTSSLPSSASSASSHPLSLLPPAVSQQLDAHIGSASLRSSWFVSSSVAIAVIRCSTGCVLDVNDRLLHESGWQRSHIIGRMMCPPYDYIVEPTAYSEKSFQDLSTQRILVDGPDGRLVPARTQRQYERSKILIQELYRGQKQSIFCVFRYQMKDGHVYEVKSAVWTTSWAEEQCADGVVRRRPESTFMVCSYADAVRVEGHHSIASAAPDAAVVDGGRGDRAPPLSESNC